MFFINCIAKTFFISLSVEVSVHIQYLFFNLNNKTNYNNCAIFFKLLTISLPFFFWYSHLKITKSSCLPPLDQQQQKTHPNHSLCYRHALWPSSWCALYYSIQLYSPLTLLISPWCRPFIVFFLQICLKNFRDFPVL